MLAAITLDPAAGERRLVLGEVRLPSVAEPGPNGDDGLVVQHAGSGRERDPPDDDGREKTDAGIEAVRP